MANNMLNIAQADEVRGLATEALHIAEEAGYRPGALTAATKLTYELVAEGKPRTALAFLQRHAEGAEEQTWGWHKTAYLLCPAHAQLNAGQPEAAYQTAMRCEQLLLVRDRQEVLLPRVRFEAAMAIWSQHQGRWGEPLARVFEETRPILKGIAPESSFATFFAHSLWMAGEPKQALGILKETLELKTLRDKYAGPVFALAALVEVSSTGVSQRTQARAQRAESLLDQTRERHPMVYTPALAWLMAYQTTTGQVSPANGEMLNDIRQSGEIGPLSPCRIVMADLFEGKDPL